MNTFPYTVSHAKSALQILQTVLLFVPECQTYRNNLYNQMNMLFASLRRYGPHWEKLYPRSRANSGLTQDLGHSFPQYGPPCRQITYISSLNAANVMSKCCLKVKSHLVLYRDLAMPFFDNPKRTKIRHHLVIESHLIT